MDGTLTRAAVVGMLCRTSDRTAGGARGVQALAPLLGDRVGVAPRLIGSPGEPRAARYDEDLRDSRGCLLEAGGQVDDALASGELPILMAADCSIAITTLPAVLRHRPGARVLWLDAHGDFNTPETTPSGFLGGMCLAAACGRWDAGFDLPPVDPARLVMCGARDIDGGERVELERAGVGFVERPAELADALRDLEVYVHLDLDVLDPGVLPSQFPAAGGLSATGLRTLLAEVADRCALVGAEITAFEAPDDVGERAALAALVAGIVEPLLPKGTHTG